MNIYGNLLVPMQNNLHYGRAIYFQNNVEVSKTCFRQFYITEPSSENIFQHVSQSFSEDCPGVEPLTHFRR